MSTRRKQNFFCTRRLAVRQLTTVHGSVTTSSTLPALINLLSPNKLQYTQIECYAVQLLFQTLIIPSSPDPRSSFAPTQSNIHDTLSITPGRYITALHRLLSDTFTQSGPFYPQRYFSNFPQRKVSTNFLNKIHDLHTYIYIQKLS
jgi:hypothetical protein